MTFLICLLILIWCIFSASLCIGDVIYYDKKMPKESLEEISRKIEYYNEKIDNEKNISIQSEWFDIKEYWEQQRDKLLSYYEEHGKIYKPE